MPEVRFEGKVITCETGDNLRRALKQHGMTPHNGASKWLNCKGFGSCGTCAVQIDGLDAPLTFMEKARFRIPPHSPNSGLRLACQVLVETDLEVTKFPGFWGQHADSEPKQTADEKRPT